MVENDKSPINTSEKDGTEVKEDSKLKDPKNSNKIRRDKVKPLTKVSIG